MTVLALNTSCTLSSYPQNSMRFGLIDIKPIEVSETLKRCGVKFRVTSRKLEPTKPVSTFEELVTLENDAIFSSVKIPKWFNAQELATAFSKRSIDFYERDTELKQEIENLKRTDRGRPFFTFVQFMKERFESNKECYLEIEAKRFLKSNFPLSFYNKFTVFDNTYYDFLDVTQGIVRAHEFLANHSRSSQMYAKRISEMQRELGPLIDKFDECAFAYARLKKYVTIWNAKSYGELSDPEFLDVEKVDFAEFEQLNSNFNTKLREVRISLLDHDPDILRKSIDFKDPTVKMFSKLLVMPSSSLNLGQ